MWRGRKGSIPLTERPFIAQRCSEAFFAQFGGEPAYLSWAPGRINLIGGHTDYNGGLALPAAINRWVSVALRPREDRAVHVVSLDKDGKVEGRLDAMPRPEASWQQFVIGTLDIFAMEVEIPSGFDAVFMGNIPDGAGLSSSAALTVAWMNLLRAWSGKDIDDLRIAKMCQSVEHTYLGMQCGLLDQLSSLMAMPEHVMWIDFRDLSVRQVPTALSDAEWVVIHSGVRRELAASEYWIRVQECLSGLEALQQAHEGVHHFRDIQMEWLCGPDTEHRRLRHVLSENQRVEAAVQQVIDGNPRALGQLLLDAHASLRDDYEVSCPELDALVALAADDPDCWGGRMIGGGFGGCTLHVVRAGQSEAFIERVTRSYRERFDPEPTAFSLQLVGGARVE